MRDDRPEDFQTVYTREGARSVRVGNFMDWTPYHVRQERTRRYRRAVARALVGARLHSPVPSARARQLFARTFQARMSAWARLLLMADDGRRHDAQG